LEGGEVADELLEEEEEDEGEGGDGEGEEGAEKLPVARGDRGLVAGEEVLEEFLENGEEGDVSGDDVVVGVSTATLQEIQLGGLR
jgi:hypothetical protein